jgi:nucleoside-diphosphate-sugar epimerase
MLLITPIPVAKLENELVCLHTEHPACVDRGCGLKYSLANTGEVSMKPAAAPDKAHKILITGASGFIGGHLCEEICSTGRGVRAAVREPCARIDSRVEQVAVAEIGPGTDWGAALSDVDTVIHLAARSHLLERKSGRDLEAYRHVNVEGTRRLARACVSARVRRFVLISSIKAVGECTRGDESFSEDTDCHPGDPYGLSKWEAEEALWRAAADGGMEAVIIRAPLVYGPCVKANFLRLMQAIDRGTPLPLGAVRARRSLVFVGNLTSAIVRSMDHPVAAGQVFHVADAEALSTKELALRLAQLMNRSVRLLPVPVRLLQLAAALMGRSEDIRRLTGSLLVSTDKIRNQLGWTPSCTVEGGLSRTVDWFRKSQS